jgi:hypothetical protein
MTVPFAKYFRESTVTVSSPCNRALFFSVAEMTEINLNIRWSLSDLEIY